MNYSKKLIFIVIFFLMVILNMQPKASAGFYNTSSWKDTSGNSYHGPAYIGVDTIIDHMNSYGYTGLDYQLYLDNPNFLCLQHGQKLSSGWLAGKYKKYFFRAVLNINGCYSELSTYTLSGTSLKEKKWGKLKSTENAKLVSILNETIDDYEYTDSTLTKKEDTEKKTIINNNNKRESSSKFGSDRSPMQEIIWQYMPQWWAKIKSTNNSQYARKWSR